MPPRVSAPYVWRIATLRDFIGDHRDEILAHARPQVATRTIPTATEAELATGLPLFVEQLSDALRGAATLRVVDDAEIKDSAAASFLAHLAVAKCADHLPIYRLEKEFARNGAPIARAAV